MVQIEITKQPLYGTVYWDGFKFIYTPVQGFSGNDVYYYTKLENGIKSSYKNYVNTSNLAPIAISPTLTADAFDVKTIDITELVTDNTNPFNELKITSIQNPTRGRIENNGTSLYFYPNTQNAIEQLQYVVSDKQYSVTGTLTLSVINGRVELPLENTTFKYKLTKNYDIGITIPPLILDWNNTSDVLDLYANTWTNINVDKYIEFSNYIESASANLNELYNDKSIYDELYSFVSLNSSSWISDRSGIDFIKNNNQKLIDAYNLITIKNPLWNDNYNNFNTISSSIEYNINNFESLEDTIANNSVNWDSNEIYNVLEPNKEKWDTNYTILSTSEKNNEWNNTNTYTDSFSSEITNDSIDFNNLYNIVTAYSGVWDNQETEATMVSSVKWDEVYNNFNLYNSLYNILTSNSGTWINDKINKDNISSSINSNSQNWINLYNILTSDYPQNWSNTDSLNSVLSDAIINFNSVYDTIVDNSSLWDAINVSSILTNNSSNYIDTYNILSSSSSNWDTNYNNVSGLSSYYNDNIQNLNSYLNTVSTNSGFWDKQELETVIVSSVKWDEVYNNFNLYNSLYNILTSNSGTWINDKLNKDNINSLLSSNSANWINLYNILTSDYPQNWSNTDSLNSVLSDFNIKLNSVYNTVTANSSLWDHTDISNFLTNNSSNYIDTYNILSSSSSNWDLSYNNVSGLSSYYNDNIQNLNSYLNTVSTNSSTWDNIYNLYTQVSSSAQNWDLLNKDNYDSLYSILCSNSSTWFSNTSLLTSISSFLEQESGKWGVLYDLIISSNWLESSNYYNLLSSIIGDNNVKFDSLYNLVTSESSKWASADFYNEKLSAIPLWDSTYDTLITKSKYNSWNSAVTDLSGLSTNFNNFGSILNNINSFIQDSLYIWDNKIGSTVLTANSANWYNAYSTVTTYSAGWFFDDKDNYKNTYSYVTGSSARLIDTTNNVVSNSSSWDKNTTDISPLTSQFLTGSDTINLSTFNLSVIGNTHIKGNLSATGGRFSIDTTLNTTSGFIVNNTDNSDAMVVDKIGGGAIFNAFMANSPVLYVKATPKTVGVNLSAISDIIGGVSNVSLTVSGNISATGYVYPFPEAITLYSSKSGAYETAYSYVTANSAAIDTFILNTKPVYDSMVTYINDGAISSFSANTIPYYNNYVNIVNDYSNKITQTSSYISLCGNALGIDSVFSSNSGKYEQTYDWINNINNVNKYNILHYFKHDDVLNSQKVNVVVQDNIKIQSWSLYADETPTLSTIYVDSVYSSINCGTSFTMAIGVDGGLSGWGNNNNGRLGDGTTVNRLTAIKVNVPPVKFVACGENFTMAIGVDGGLSGWGGNNSGQLGNGGTVNRLTPIKVNVPPVKFVACGDHFTMAIGVDGGLSGWGANNVLQILNTTNSLLPFKINVPPVKFVACGNNFTMAIGVDGGLTGWGGNGNGQLGNGITAISSSPIKVNVPPVKFVACGESFTMAIGVDGGLSGWGLNAHGQLGNGTTTSSLTPIKVNVPPVKFVDCDQLNTIASGIDGGLSGWGGNGNGQLGDGTTFTRSTPIKVNVPPVKFVACGRNNFTMAIGVDGGLSGWGNNNIGQLGDGTTVVKFTPIKVNVPLILTSTENLTSYVITSPYDLSVDILSTTHGNFGKVNNPISITNNNLPYLNLTNKNSATNLDSSWLGTSLPRGSILQFNLINNNTNTGSVSGLLINLTVQKQ